MRSRAELFDDAGRKRALADQQAAAYGDAKRQRIANGAGVASQQREIPPLGPGPNSLADVFALTSNAQLRSFNASNVPLELVAKISVSTLARVDQQLLDRAIQGIRGRLASLEAAATQLAINPETAPLDVEDDDDDYEPDFSAAEDAEQILNKLDNEAPTTTEVARVEAASSLGLGAFQLPTAPQLTTEQALKVGQATVARVFDMMRSSSDEAGALAAAGGSSSSNGARKSGERAGLNRVAATTYDKDAWITILTRLATRSVGGLEGEGEEEGDEEKEEKKKVGGSSTDVMAAGTHPPVLSDKIRESLFRYVLEDFRRRIDVAVAWLCEEWYNDRLLKAKTGHYEEWVVKVLDGFLPYLHSQDNKVLTRFLSEIPALSAPLLQRIKSLCRDPSMVPVALTSLLYQLMMRPPARALALDTMQEIWIECRSPLPICFCPLALFSLLTKTQPSRGCSADGDEVSAQVAARLCAGADEACRCG